MSWMAFRPTKPDSPCKDCRKRHEACHDDCEEFRVYREKRAEIEKRRREIASGTEIDIERAEKKKHSEGWGLKRNKI